MRKRKVLTIGEIAKYFDQGRNSVAQEIHEQRVDLYNPTHVIEYVVQKVRDNAREVVMQVQVGKN